MDNGNYYFIGVASYILSSTFTSLALTAFAAVASKAAARVARDTWHVDSHLRHGDRKQDLTGLEGLDKVHLQRAKHSPGSVLRGVEFLNIA